MIVKFSSLSANANGFVTFYSVIESANLSRAGGLAGRQAKTDGRTDERDEDNSLFSQFYKRA